MAKKKSNPVSSLKDSVKNQLLDLKRRQRKLELIIQITEYVSGLTDNKEEPYPEAAEEVATIFAAFANKVMTKVEGGAELTSAPKRIVANHTMEGRVAPVENAPKVPSKPVPSPMDNVAEKIKFMQANKHLENAKVQATTEQGTTVNGKVRGADAPFLIVIDDNGARHKVLPEKITQVA